MEHEVNYVSFLGRESPSHPLSGFIHQLDFIPGSAVLPANQRAADANSVSQSLWGENARSTKREEGEGRRKSLG